MDNNSSKSLAGRRCFVTVGATASFIKLLREVLAPHFLDCLAARGFRELVVQTGPDHEWALEQVASMGELTSFLATAKDTEMPAKTDAKRESPRWPVIEVVSYTTDLPSLMLPCRGEARKRLPGAMISHAGSGSILDAVRCDVPLIVVANPDLLGNHQAELAEAVHDAGWAIHGELGHLEDALAELQTREAEAQAEGLPPYQEPPFPTAESERCGLFDWAAMYAAGGELGMATTEPNLLRLD
ncbi:N-acetylglucosaminyldiphosphodolichol N-acetylglucosaminyltransferase catalytic subunit alg13 [Sporothrix bragantina]|uniref:UDP-N-acetylglucosamine transferase subunit ALG13 n=1 Tax=Sporothrix bragantina TaxID=671064 RepID=A0ABP0B3A4_9PEZI